MLCVLDREFFLGKVVSITIVLKMTLVDSYVSITWFFNMLNQPHTKLSSKTYRYRVFIDAFWVVITFIGIYAISSYWNVSDHYYLWARQYEKALDIDELLPALLASLFALLWFTKRRINESSLLIQKNHFLLQRILEVQEVERKRIARDLHDDLGQYLSAIKAQAASLRVELDGTTEIQQTAKSIAESAAHAYDTTRNLMHSLRPVALDELGLSAALEHLVGTWQSIYIEAKRVHHATKHTEYMLSIEGNIDDLDDRTNIAVFRIIQEALTNCAKHAQANTVHVSIARHLQQLRLSIADDGIGFDSTLPILGFGLLGIQERVDALNGQLQIISGHKLGLKMLISIEAFA